MNLAGGIARRSMAFATRAARWTVVGTMNSLVIITRPLEPLDDDYNVETREYTPREPIVVYDSLVTPGIGAVAGISVAQGPITMELGDEPQYYSSMTVYIPSQVPVQPMINDIVQIVDSPDTPIIGRYFRVVDVPVGGRIDASIDLQCQGIAPQQGMGRLMQPEEAGRALSSFASKVSAAAAPLPTEGLLRAAHQVAQRIRVQAARTGRPVAVRVVERAGGVRLTVRGPSAARYRRMAEQELARLAPESAAEVRAQITRRLK